MTALLALISRFCTMLCSSSLRVEHAQIVQNSMISSQQNWFVKWLIWWQEYFFSECVNLGED